MPGLIRTQSVVDISSTSGGSAPLNLFFNSLEPGGTGTDPNVLWADDFSRGYWFQTTNNPVLANAGWNGTPFGAADPLGQNFGRAGAGVNGTTCATNGGHFSPVQQGQARGMADHSLSQSVTELYFRYYIKFLPGYQFGQEKGLTFNKGPAGVGGIFAGTLFYGAGATGDPPPKPHFLNQDLDVNHTQNQGNDYTIPVGNWSCIQVHIKYVAVGSDLLEIWMDDCGVNGTTHPATPTLRLRYPNTSLRSSNHDPNPSLGSIWIENWANPGALGETQYDKIMCKKTSPIGFYV